MANVEIRGIDTLIEKLDTMASLENIEQAMKEATLFVENVAREKAPKKMGDLRRSIESKVEVEGDTVIGTVFTPLFYAPYVEFGTGIHAANGDGRKDVPWRYKDDAGEWHTTSGMHPQPYLRPALYENEQIIKQYLREALTDD